MANRLQRLAVLGCVGGVVALCAGCGIDVKLGSTPEPVKAGGLLTYTVDLTNNTGCDLNNVALMLMPLMPISSAADFLNSEECVTPFAVICVAVPELCQATGDSCASSPDEPFCQAFCASVPTFCTSTPCDVVGAVECDAAVKAQVAAMTLDDILNALPSPMGARLRSGGLDALIDILPPTLRQQLVSGNLTFLKDKLPLQAQNRLAAPQNKQLPTIQAGNAIDCGSFFGSNSVNCPIGDLAKGQKVQVTIVGHPQAPGLFGNTAAVMGDPVADCRPSLAPDGGGCSITTVTPGVNAPAVSAWGLAGLTLLLASVGLFYLRRRRVGS